MPDPKFSGLQVFRLNHLWHRIRGEGRYAAGTCLVDDLLTRVPDGPFKQQWLESIPVAGTLVLVNKHL